MRCQMSCYWSGVGTVSDRSLILIPGAISAADAGFDVAAAGADIIVESTASRLVSPYHIPSSCTSTLLCSTVLRTATVDVAVTGRFCLWCPGQWRARLHPTRPSRPVPSLSLSPLVLQPLWPAARSSPRRLREVTHSRRPTRREHANMNTNNEPGCWRPVH